MRVLFIAVYVLWSAHTSRSFVIGPNSEENATQVGTDSRFGRLHKADVKRGLLLKRVRRSTSDRDDAQKKLLENLVNLTEVLANNSSVQQNRGLQDHDQSNPNEMASIVLKPLLGSLPASSASIAQGLLNLPERSPKSGAGAINMFKSADNQPGSCVIANDTQRQLLNALFNRMAGDFEMAQSLLSENKNCPGRDSSKGLSLTVQTMPSNEGRFTRLTWTRKKSCEKRKKINQAGFACDNKQSKSQFQSSDEDDKSDEILPSDSIKESNETPRISWFIKNILGQRRLSEGSQMVAGEQSKPVEVEPAKKDETMKVTATGSNSGCDGDSGKGHVVESSVEKSTANCVDADPGTATVTANHHPNHNSHHPLTTDGVNTTSGGSQRYGRGGPGGVPRITVVPTTPDMSDLVSKVAVRRLTWKRLESCDVVLFPRPCTYRIPRIKGENEAVEKLAELDVFKNAKVVKVNLDKAHERLRLEVIQSGKELIVGTPGLRDVVFYHMRPPMEPNKASNRLAASRMGIFHLATALEFHSNIKAELVVLGSVAVDKKGRRVGKGEGFSDLEFALLSALGGISPNATVATIVHDHQVYDEIPESVFAPFDVPVDIIVTPTKVINVEHRLPRPSILWNILSQRRVNAIPVIKQLIDQEQSKGVTIELKEAESDAESRHVPPMMNRRRFFPRRRRQSAPEPRGPPPTPAARPRRRGFGGRRGFNNRRDLSAPSTTNTRTFRRVPRGYMNGVDPTRAEGQTMQRPQRRSPRRISKPRITFDYSVRVNGLNSTVRIRDLKAALNSRGVRPTDISWRANRGVALLHFAKRRAQASEGTTTSSVPCVNSVDDVVNMLQGLSVKSDDGPTMDLNFEAAKQQMPPNNAQLAY